MRHFSFLRLTNLLIFAWLLGCGNKDISSKEDLSIATQDYVVLAEKAISQQADFDLDGWANMLADDVEFFLPEDSCQAKLIGKKAIISYWENLKKENQIQRIDYSDFSTMPIRSSKSLKFSDLAGIYVFSFFKGKTTYTNGKTRQVQMNYCLHFNEKKLIDRYYPFSPLTPNGGIINYLTKK